MTHTMKYLWLYTMTCMLLLSACQNNNDDVHQSARPDSDNMPAVKLSEEDRQKLAEARGKKASKLTAGELARLLEKEEEKTIICYFWSANDKKARKGLMELAQLAKTSDPSMLGMLLIHPPVSKNEEENLNTFIREQGMDADLYLLATEKPLSLPGSKKKWSGDYPAYYFYQAIDEAGVWYQGYHDAKEVEALLQPFLLAQ